MADAEGWSCPDTRAIAQRELSEPVTFLREATPAVFRFGGNHSPRGVKLRQVGPIAFASVSVPFRSSPPASPGIGVMRSAVAVEGLAFRLESEGTWWHPADAVTGRGGVSPVESERTKAYHAPLRRGALRGETGRGRSACHTAPFD